MKANAIFWLALITLAGCSKDPETATGTPGSGNASKAYLSIGLSSPANGMRINSGPGTGTADVNETTISAVTVVGYDAGGSKVGVYTPAITAGNTASEAFEVSSKVSQVFVVVNPTAGTTAAINKEVSFGALCASILTEDVDMLTGNNAAFMMTSESGLAPVRVHVAASTEQAAIDAAKAAAKADSKTIKVDRAVAKVKMSVDANLTVKHGAEAEIEGFMLTTTNKSCFPYAELVTYATSTSGKYRKDPNWMSVGNTITAIEAAFNWVKNPDTHADWKAANASEYCLENTMDVSAQDYNNTTKAILKAAYAPAGVTLGSSWYRVGGVVKTFAQLQADYARPGFADKAAYDAFAAAFGAADFGTLTEAALDGVANGGYVAARVSPYMIEYFQKSVCYYDVNIMHDNTVFPGLLGRWGVVRNNWYTLNIESISQAGKPYIPDPTDPDITDPSNPDPTDPSPDDDQMGYISVTITINPWTIWSQGVDL